MPSMAELMQGGAPQQAPQQAAVQPDAAAQAGPPQDVQQGGQPQAPDFQQGAAQFQQQQQQGILQQLDQRHQQVAIDSATIRIGRALIKGVTDQPTFEVFRRVIAVMMGPQAAQAFGQSYEQAKPQLAAMLAHSATVRRSVSAHERSITLVKKALAADPAAAQGLWKGAVGTALSTARDDGDWRSILGEMQNAGAPKDVLNGFDTVYSPAAATSAQQMAGEHALPDYE